ncbi:hypothetical protein FOL46_006096 [Perkinsus olseni]|uniref:Uncharacterized protein n=1 Tax=Perkinsus olseni TaxID=32597 RepID=A0A7J6LMK5_PEROL|nr:hypothetical protein FOL46_006096 [Perkinsus olseni]
MATPGDPSAMIEVEVMVNYGARLEGPLDTITLPLTVKDSEKRRVDIVLIQPWMSRLNFVQPGYRIIFKSLLLASKDSYDLKCSREDFTENFYRVTGDVEISDGKKARKRDSSGELIDQLEYGVVVITKDGDVKVEDGRHLCWDCNKIDYRVVVDLERGSLSSSLLSAWCGIPWPDLILGILVPLSVGFNLDLGNRTGFEESTVRSTFQSVNLVRYGAVLVPIPYSVLDRTRTVAHLYFNSADFSEDTESGLVMHRECKEDTNSLVTKRISYLPLTAITPQMGKDGKVINIHCVFVRNTQMYASRPTGGGPSYSRQHGPSYVALTVAVVDGGWKWLPVASWAREDTNDAPERLFTMQIELHTNQVTSLPWLTTGDVLRIHRTKVIRYDSVKNTTRLAHNGREKTSVTIVPISEHNTHRDYQPGTPYNVRGYPVGPNTGEVYEETKKLHIFAAEALKRQSLKVPEDSSTVIGRVSHIERSSDRFHVSTVTDDDDNPLLREVTVLVRSPAQAMGKAFLFHHLRSGDWVMVEEMEIHSEKWGSYIAMVGRITRLPEWSYDVQHTISLMKKAETDKEAEQLEELVEPPARSDAENEPPPQSFADDYAWTQELDRLPVGRAELDKAIEQGGLTGPVLTQSKDGTVEVDDVFDFIEE